jgi:hypothetical protein
MNMSKYELKPERNEVAELKVTELYEMLKKLSLDGKTPEGLLLIAEGLVQLREAAENLDSSACALNNRRASEQYEIDRVLHELTVLVDRVNVALADRKDLRDLERQTLWKINKYLDRWNR